MLTCATRLAGLRLTPAREAEIIEELSQHLDDRYEELRASGSSDADARRMTLEELSEAGELAQRMRTLSQSHSPAPIVHGRASAVRCTGSGRIFATLRER